MAQLDGQKVLVVGGSSGIGEATAARLKELGASVTLASRSRDKLEAAAERIGGADVAVLDTRSDEGVAQFFADAPQFDHIVISAAQTPGGKVKELPLGDAYAALDSKFWGAYRVARAAQIRPGGTLTFISGFLSVRPGDWVLQGAINAALESLARGLALELSPTRVNAVSPGVIATPLWGGMAEADRQAMFDATAAGLPAKRIGHPEDIANAIAYLVMTPYATGSTVLVDGGGAIA
ncbi:SDR family oxidoreductase [Novosphingobium guangzhouense]|uniref:Short-chain dehydrogenase n=1 Tax=Novosphingobium guangzhouense TaxID=1850347 RepID=A0A2K2G5W5_9SPHN|nr:SDR family oxidoreductase [Novosphingobium guangzhouense]PNU06427.1 short-chain dehydrogenase [Novosphingobium guangzhouense]